MKVKGNAISLIIVLVFLGAYFLVAPTTSGGQSLRLASTTESVTTSGTTILTGQIIPAVNTGPDAGVGSYGAPDNQVWQPMEYHLYDQQGKDVKLSFDNPSLNSVMWQKWLDDNPQKEQIQTQVAEYPPLWNSFPKYVTYTYVWQKLTGQWVELAGQFTSSGFFEVSTIRQIIPPTQQGNRANTPTADATASLKTHQVTFTGQIVVTQNNPGSGPTYHGFTGGFQFKLTDTIGKEQRIIVYSSQPNCQTSVTFANSSVETDLFDSGNQNHWAIFTGWVLYPPRPASQPGTVELQSAQILPLTTLTSTPNP